MLSWEKLGPKIEKKEKSCKSCCGNQNQTTERRLQQFTSTQEKEERKHNMSVLLVNVPSRAQPLVCDSNRFLSYSSPVNLIMKKLKFGSQWKSKSSALPGKLRSVRLGNNHVVKAFFSNPIEEPIVRKALQVP